MIVMELSSSVVNSKKPSKSGVMSKSNTREISRKRYLSLFNNSMDDFILLAMDTPSITKG